MGARAAEPWVGAVERCDTLCLRWLQSLTCNWIFNGTGNSPKEMVLRALAHGDEIVLVREGLQVLGGDVLNVYEVLRPFLETGGDAERAEWEHLVSFTRWALLWRQSAQKRKEQVRWFNPFSLLKRAVSWISGRESEEDEEPLCVVACEDAVVTLLLCCKADPHMRRCLDREVCRRIAQYVWASRDDAPLWTAGLEWLPSWQRAETRSENALCTHTPSPTCTYQCCRNCCPIYVNGVQCARHP